MNNKQGLFMSFKIKVLGVASLMVLLPAISVADSHMEKVAPIQDKPNDPTPPSIKLDDILAGKYSGKEAEVDETKKAEPKAVEVKLVEEKPIAAKPAAVAKTVAVKKEKKAPAGYTVDDDLARSIDALLNPKPVKQGGKVTQAGASGGGWVYVGKFVAGQWDLSSGKAFAITTLPQVGASYAVRAYSNIRSGYPSKGGMPKVIKVLPQGTKVKVLAVHNSGNSGHYWAKVSWN